MRESERFNTQGNTELASVSSLTLDEVLGDINKESLNLEAELVLRTMGKERGATAPDTDPTKMATRGDDKAGLAVVRSWLEGAGIPTKNLALHDGSGLSRLNLVTPESTIGLLSAISKSKNAGVFKDSLAIAGRDGTLRNRFRPAAGRIFAKTGTLSNIDALSGFIVTQDGQLLAVSIYCNNDTSSNSSTSVINAITLLLADYRK